MCGPITQLPNTPSRQGAQIKAQEQLYPYIYQNLNPYAGHFQQLERYESVSKSFRTGSLERELQMLQFFATRCSYIAILWVSLLGIAVIALCGAFNECLFLLFLSLST